MNTQTTGIGMILMAIAIFVIAMMAFPRIDKALKSKTMSECAQAANSPAAEGGFNGGVYKICVEDSGYTTLIK